MGVIVLVLFFRYLNTAGSELTCRPAVIRWQGPTPCGKAKRSNSRRMRPPLFVSRLRCRGAKVERPAGNMALRLLADSNHYVTPQDVYNLLLLRHHVGWTDWAQHVVPFLGWRLLRASDVAASSSATCAISQVGQLVCFGENENDLPPDLGPVVAVAAGAHHICAVKASGELVCFGINGYGQRDVPADLGPVVAVAAGWYHTCAVKASCFASDRNILVSAMCLSISVRWWPWLRDMVTPVP